MRSLAEPVIYGGQAVLEGVMMRGPDRMAIAVRKPDGNIALQVQDVGSILKRYPILRLPVLRGVVALFETLGLGISALLYSAQQAAPEGEELSRTELTVTTVVGLGLAVGLFFVFPTWVLSLLRSRLGHPLWANLAEGAFRLLLFVGYLKLISLMKDIQRVLQYHGAEHKVINALEGGVDLTVENARRFSREHKRCGTSFLLYVVLLSIIVFAFLGWPNLLVRILSRLVLVPVVAGIAYEFIRLAGRHDNALVRWLSRPGMWLQGFTTREPDDSQLEVAIVSLQAVRA